MKTIRKNDRDRWEFDDGELTCGDVVFASGDWLPGRFAAPRSVRPKGAR